MTEGIKQFLDQYLTTEEKKARVVKEIEAYENALKDFKEALNELEGEVK